MKSSTVWRGHSTRPFLPAGTAKKASGHLSGRGPSILLTQDRSVAQKPHWGFCCCANASLPWQAEQAHHTTSKEKQSVPDGERPVVHIAIACGFFRVRPIRGRTLFLVHHGWVYVKTYLPFFSPWLHRGWFCAVPPSGRTIPPLQGRREQRRHWFWYPVRRSFPCPQRTA